MQVEKTITLVITDEGTIYKYESTTQHAAHCMWVDALGHKGFARATVNEIKPDKDGSPIEAVCDDIADKYHKLITEGIVTLKRPVLKL